VAPAAYLEGLTVSPDEAAEAEDWEQHHHNLLFDGMDSLDDRSRDIIQSRWLLDPKATCRNWPTSTAFRPSASASSKPSP
jgi:RNA polymerase sigma-32 factor